MSAPPGFNPNASLLPDPGPSAAPIQVMKGGGLNGKSQRGGAFTSEQLAELKKYQLAPGGVIANEFDDETKTEFLKQVADKTRCRRTTGDSIILGKDCWAVVKVIRALLNAKIKRGNVQVPVAPSEPSEPGAPSASAEEPSVAANEPAKPVEPSAPAEEPAPGGEEPAEPGKEPAPKENVHNIEPPFSNNNHNRLAAFLDENGNAIPKPSPCKNRGTRKQANNSNDESVAEEERMAKNEPKKGGYKQTRKNRKNKKQ